MTILLPTIQKGLWTAGVMLFLGSTLLLRSIPAQLDILDLNEIPGFVLIVFGRTPISLFNWLTFNRYTPTGGGFLVFPTWQQLLFALIFDVVLVYIIVCFGLYGYHKWKHKKGDIS